MVGILRKLSHWGDWCGLLLLYGVFLFSMGYWLVQREKFRDVETWPKVAAKIIDHGTQSVSFRSEGRGGSRVGSRSLSWVTFDYVVDGRVYQSSVGSPNGGGVPSRPFFVEVPDAPWDESWDAFYKPGSPEVAVLSLEPYDGGIWLILAVVTAIPVGAHGFIWVSRRIRRFRIWRARDGALSL